MGRHIYHTLPDITGYFQVREELIKDLAGPWESRCQKLRERCQCTSSLSELLHIAKLGAVEWRDLLVAHEAARSESQVWALCFNRFQNLLTAVDLRMRELLSHGLDIIAEPDPQDVDDQVMRFLTNSLKSPTERYAVALHFLRFLLVCSLAEGVSRVADSKLTAFSILCMTCDNTDFFPLFVRWPGVADRIRTDDESFRRAWVKQTSSSWLHQRCLVHTEMLFELAVVRSIVQSGKESEEPSKWFDAFMQFATGAEESPVASALDLPTDVRLPSLLSRCVYPLSVFRNLAYASHYCCGLTDGSVLFLTLPQSPKLYVPPEFVPQDLLHSRFDCLGQCLDNMNRSFTPFYKAKLDEIRTAIIHSDRFLGSTDGKVYTLWTAVIDSLRSAPTRELTGLFFGYFTALALFDLGRQLDFGLPEDSKHLLVPLSQVFYIEILKRILSEEQRKTHQGEICQLKEHAIRVAEKFRKM